MVMWEIVRDPCPALDQGTYLCSLREGHDDDHVRDEWENGEIVGPIYWPSEPVAIIMKGSPIMRKIVRLLARIMICGNGHVYNGDDYQSCPYC